MQIVKKTKTEHKTEHKPKPNFFPGDFAVYPAHGVGRIESIETREVGGEKQEFYIMNIIENQMVIMIPVRNASSVGLRKIIEEKNIKDVYDILQTKRDKPIDRTWNRIQKKYMSKIMTGDLCEVAEVFRDLYDLNLKKGISFEQNKLLDTAKGLLVKELCIVKKEDETTIMSELESFF